MNPKVLADAILGRNARAATTGKGPVKRVEVQVGVDVALFPILFWDFVRTHDINRSGIRLSREQDGNLASEQRMVIYS